MADVSVQNERINGWIPSSATNVILNWPERIKTQPHDDRDNCFLHFDSKGPCGMTVNNDIHDDSATKHSDSHRFRKQRLCFGLFTKHSADGVLRVVMSTTCWAIGDEQCELQVKDFYQLVRFGSMTRHKFDHGGRQKEKETNGEITISTKWCIQNLTKKL